MNKFARWHGKLFFFEKLLVAIGLFGLVFIIFFSSMWILFVLPLADDLKVLALVLFFFLMIGFKIFMGTDAGINLSVKIFRGNKLPLKQNIL